MEKGHHSKVKSKAMHKLSLDKISEELISNGNPRKLFKLFEQIGKGGFGAVYSAKRIEDKRQFAIKRVPHYTKKEKWSNLDEIYFLKLSSSRSIVKYYQSFISRDELWVSFYFPFSFFLFSLSFSPLWPPPSSILSFLSLSPSLPYYASSFSPDSLPLQIMPSSSSFYAHSPSIHIYLPYFPIPMILPLPPFPSLPIPMILSLPFPPFRYQLSSLPFSPFLLRFFISSFLPFIVG